MKSVKYHQKQHLGVCIPSAEALGVGAFCIGLLTTIYRLRLSLTSQTKSCLSKDSNNRCTFSSRNPL